MSDTVEFFDGHAALAKKLHPLHYSQEKPAEFRRLNGAVEIAVLLSLFRDFDKKFLDSPVRLARQVPDVTVMSGQLRRTIREKAPTVRLG